MMWVAVAILHCGMAVGTVFETKGAATEDDGDPAVVPSVELGGTNFRIPSGLELELVAVSPLVTNPIVGDWDDQGRLVLVEAAGVRQGVDEQRLTRPNRLVRLIDDDGDGRFDRRIIAATDLSFPEGVLCLGHRILVAAPPEIWCFLDEDGDGICERRDVWFDGKTLTHCANDLHGPYLGLDGWIYWCKGAFAEQEHELRDGARLKTRAAHIFRRRLEGGAVESVMTGGMDNPVEVAFSQVGERFFTSTFLQHPSQGRRDGIAHAVYGSVFGKDHSVIDGHRRTGPLMPIMTHLGPAAPSGLLRLKNPHLIAASMGVRDDEDVLVAAQFNLQKVSLHRLIPEGASYRTEDSDLLVGDRIDFHPTDVLEDANGSLLIVDTGGWYDLCCPSSGGDQRRATGGIYRLSSPQMARIRDARVVKNSGFTAASNVDRNWMDEPFEWARKRALERLIADGDRSIGCLEDVVRDRQQPRRLRLEALWSLCRIGNMRAMQVIDQLLDDSDHQVQHAALNALAVHRQGTPSRLISVLHSNVPLTVRRAAAEALGRTGGDDPTVIAALVAAFLESTTDRIFEHSVLFAIMERASADSMQSLLSSTTDSRAAGIALRVLNELEPESLDAKQVFALARSGIEETRTTALRILERRSEWSAILADELKALWDDASLHADAHACYLELCHAWGPKPELLAPIEMVLLDGARGHHSVVSERALIALTRFDRFPIPQPWIEPLRELLRSSSVSSQIQFASWLQRSGDDETNVGRFADLWIELAEANRGDPETQLRLLAGVSFGKSMPAEFVVLAQQTLIESDQAHLRQTAANVLSRIRLSDSAVDSLIDQLDRVDPLLLSKTIESIVLSGSDPAIENLVAKLPNLPSLKTITWEQVQKAFLSRNDKIAEQARMVFERIAQPPDDLENSLDDWEHRLLEGDSQRGLQVFRSTRAACSACHTIGYVGGNIGPDLTKIGATRTRRDLLEAILFPSYRFAQSYRPQQVLTHEGEVFNGLIAAQNDQEIELIVAADRRVRIRHDAIEQSQPSQVSIMPAGLENVLSLQELSDLISFLQSAR